MEIHAQIGSPIETQIQALVQAQFQSRTEAQIQTQDKAHAKWGGFLLQEVLWAVGVWSVILTLVPIAATQTTSSRVCLAGRRYGSCGQHGGGVVFPGGRPKNYAACLCIAPFEGALPRIAFTERSIAAHSRPISAAARPSAKYSRAPSPLPSAINRSARLVICPPHTGARNLANCSRAMVTMRLSTSSRRAGAPLSTTA